MKPLNLVINKNDRRDALLGMGISPGEDESYDEQAKRLMAQKSVIQRDRRNVLERLEAMIQTNRSKRSAEGTWTPSEFAMETLAKTIPTPSEVNPANIIKSIPELAKGAVEVAKHPLATLKQIALNPPEATTVASMMLPGAALKAYRELTPLAARTYIHHMAGVPTPFSHVTGKERAALTEMAQFKIDELLDEQRRLELRKSLALKSVNNIRLKNRAQLLDYFDEEDFSLPEYKGRSGLNSKTTPQLRELAVEHYKRQRPSVFNTDLSVKGQELIGVESDNANVREEFKKLTGEQLKAFQVYSQEHASALGKTYVEPMIDKATGKIVPKAIKDTYKFYPDVYGYPKGKARQDFKDLMTMIDLKEYAENNGVSALAKMLPGYIKEIAKSTFGMNSTDPLGIVARKLGMRRPTSIIDIPLTKPPPLNAYDKAAILMGAKAAAEKKE